MQTKFYTAYNYGTYYFCNIITNVLYDPLPFIRSLEDFAGDLNTQSFLKPFPKWSALHRFSYFIIHSLFMEPDENISIEAAFKWHGMEHETYEAYKKSFSANEIENVPSFDDWLYELPMYEAYDKLMNLITQEVFSILFANRKVLNNLNLLIAGYMEGCTVTEPDLLQFQAENNLVKRQTIPQWVARAVFYRDRGRCTFCQNDLTGLLSPQWDRHIDHIVPLATGGINDITNLQLLCGSCNLTKSSKILPVSNLYEAWYDYEDDRVDGI